MAYREVRVVDTGEALTFARVLFSPEGEPVFADVDIVYGDALSDLVDLTRELSEAVKKPVISAKGLLL